MQKEQNTYKSQEPSIVKKESSSKPVKKNNYDDISIKETDLVEDKCVKFNPSDFKKKYRKFVEELNILMENIQLANQMIDVSTPGKKVDDGLRMIMLNLKGCEQNLLNAIQSQISDEILLGICLQVNDDLNQSSERYNLLKSGAKPPSFVSAFGWSTKPKKVEQKKSEKEAKSSNKREKNYEVNDDQNEQVQNQNANNVNKPTDIFDLFSSSNDGGNKNTSNNQPQITQSKDSKSTNLLDIDDIISSFSNVNVNNNTENNSSSAPVFNFTNTKPQLNNNVSDDLFNKPYLQLPSNNLNNNTKPDITQLFNLYSLQNPQNNNQGQFGNNMNMIQPNMNMNTNMNMNSGQFVHPYGNQQFNPNPNLNGFPNFNNGVPQNNMNMNMNMGGPYNYNNLGYNYNKPVVGGNVQPTNNNVGGGRSSMDFNNVKPKDKIDGVNPFS